MSKTIEEKEEKQRDVYNPSEEAKKTRKMVYTDFEVMRRLRSNRYKYFNDRTLKEFIDDSELRLTNYVPTREEQGKEDWQANFSHPTTSNKMNAIMAGIALDVPETRITAKNENSIKSARRAFIMKNLVKHSYDKDNKEEMIYNEAFEAASKGTVIVADMYQRQVAKRKKVTKYDPITGDMEFIEEDKVIKDEIINFVIPLEDLYIWDFYIPNIQDQPKIIWSDSMGQDKFREEFSKFPDYKFVKMSPKDFSKDEQSRYFNEGWATRVDKNDTIEVLKFYNRFSDTHVIVANGVVLFDGPMLLGRRKKWYPFAKTIYSMFATDFFYGNSHPNKMMGEQDVSDALYNMSIDKTYKSMVPNLLVGNVNKDDFDLEDPYISLDTKIYVQDIQQVKEMPVSGINNADVQMINMINKDMDLTSVDANQQGVTGKGVTAREVVIANENARKLKGVFFMFLTSLWIQKMKLRIMNILSFYMAANIHRETNDSATDEGNKIDQYNKIVIDNAELSDGSSGTLGIDIVGTEEELPTQEETDQKSDRTSEKIKDNFQQLSITSDYLDNWNWDIKVISESIFQKESSLSQAKMEEKLNTMGNAFPDFFQINKEKIFKQFMIAYDDDPDEYDTSVPQLAQATEAGQEVVEATQEGVGQAIEGTENVGEVPPQV